MRDKPNYYDFNGIRLFSVQTHIEILDTGKEHTPSPIHRGFLLALVKKAPDVASYEELWRDVWRSKNDMSDTDLRNIQTTKGNLTNWLKGIDVKDSLIDAEPGKGYRLNCEVVLGWFENEPEEPVQKIPETAKEIPAETGVVNEIIVESKFENWQEILNFHKSYIISASVFYGLLFLIAAIMEIAYKFDVYGKRAIAWGLLLMLINSVAVLSACGMISYRLYFQKNGFLSATRILLGAVLISILLSTQFLPFQPVTEAGLNTQPAIVAFGKNALVYFLPLGIAFLLLPFYVVIARRLIESRIVKNMPSDMFSIEPKWLLIICLSMAVVSYISTNYLLDKLNTESDYHSLFVGLIILRFVVCFGLGLTSVAWYHTQFKRRKLNTSRKETN